MSLAAPPLRFLVAVVAGWALVRIALTLPDWTERAPANAPGIAALPVGSRVAERRPHAAMASTASRRPIRLSRPAIRVGAKRRTTAQPPVRMAPPAFRLIAPAPLQLQPPPERASPIAPLPVPRASAGRWSGSAWLLVRREAGGAALAPGGTLGGSQAGARLRYRLNGDPARPLALGARLYLPLWRTAAAEAAAGLDWRPLARLPVHLLAERREALGRDGRSAFALAIYGGDSMRLAGGLRLDAFGQAGIVGARSRDLFADGAARLTLPLGRFEIGGGAWAAAQPGAERLDAGPHLSWRLPVPDADVRVAAEWRFRLAGDAAPGSGPALTVATDF